MSKPGSNHSITGASFGMIYYLFWRKEKGSDKGRKIECGG